MSKTKKIPLMGPVRVNLEAFGVAILAAVLLKWFCIEAYQIPTSSMQPTLMGDDPSGVYDRILVDKILPTFREPQRWDITVFRYPLQKNQSYVKRIVGMPNDRLTIGGGNVYQVEERDGRTGYRVERKPDDLQEDLWKEVYPARRVTRNESEALEKTWRGQPSRAAEETETGFTLDLAKNIGQGSCRLYFRDTTGNGLCNELWDGYPPAVARAIRDKLKPAATEIAPDARLAATLTPEGAIDEVAFEIEVGRPEHDLLTFALAVKGGKGRLEVRKDRAEVAASSPEFAVPFASGQPVRLRLAHVDDQLIAWVDGDEVQRLETGEWDCRTGCVADSGKFAPGQRVTPQITGSGKGRLQIDDVVLERDLHYTQSTAPELIEVPDGHYYMMGDNTLQSVDSRGWTAITLGVTDAGEVVRPVEPGTPGVRNVRGNKRAMPLNEAPDRDETPIPIPSENAIVMIDEYGEILRLKGQAGSNWGDVGRVAFRAADGTEWEPQTDRNAKGISFVPRADIQGRALMVFYPTIPFSWLTGNNWPGRLGFVR